MFVIRVVPIGALDIPNAIFLRGNASQQSGLCFCWDDVAGMGKARGEHQDDECVESQKVMNARLLVYVSAEHEFQPDVLGKVESVDRMSVFRYRLERMLPLNYAFNADNTKNAELVDGVAECSMRLLRSVGIHVGPSLGVSDGNH